MSIAAWQPLMPALVTRHRVVRCDFRGQLLTPGPYARSWEEHADDVAALLDHLGIAKAHVAGASFGAEVAMFLAALHPDHVGKLTIITATEKTTESMRSNAREGKRIAERASAGEPCGPELFRAILDATWSEAWLAKQPPDFMEQRLRQVALLPASFYEGAAAILALLESLDVTPHLASIHAPTLVIAGEHDRVFPVEHSRAIAAAIRNAQLVIVPDTGHGLLFERPEEVLRLMAPATVPLAPQSGERGQG